MNPTVHLIAEIDKRVIKQVAALEAEAFGRGGLNKWHLPVIIRYGCLHVLEIDGRIIGSAEMIRSWGDSRDAYLVGLSVSRKYRNRGYGRLLLNEVIDKAKRDGCARLLLTVDERNGIALNLYRSFGFNIDATLPDEYGLGEDRLLMELDLAEVAVE